MEEPVRAEFLVLSLSRDELAWLRELAADAGKEPVDVLRSFLSHAVYEVRCREAAALRAAAERGQVPDLFDRTGATVEDVRRLSMLWHGAMGAREELEAEGGEPEVTE
ncbi:hypothetical protein [Segniliparus rugosus]|uniref:Uncharacterized protein n=1 Tax=Segniliparus rugosus (strain ATCC BAA-974 / DSM 45345 / CCUG 50838 / CIP 108380 / JCM 13579 / CDC 945) TaxID=679197 RepID=E5XT54_SEGRC|nr:hypothetical protein [Segniliparus rugosus]EFV12465.1 hypothetical protein HMPREF9336_02676 [Segniliparus rugosus ATCC BAA-974]